MVATTPFSWPPPPTVNQGSPMPKNAGKKPAKYVIVRNHLLDLVRNGLANGSPVPSERELCEQFEVSRMTVRQAIDTLVVDGVLERHQGRGTFVMPPKLDLQVRLTSFTQEMQRRGMEPGVVMLLAETVPANETVAAALELEADAEVHHLRRLLTANAIPMAIEENWIPAALLPDLLRTSPNFSIYAELTQVGTGQPPGGLYHGVLVWTISPVPAKVPHLTAPAHVLTPHLGTITH